MKNSKMEKLVLILLMVLTLGMLISTPVFAADSEEDEDEVLDLSPSKNETKNENNTVENKDNTDNNATLNTNAVNNSVKNNTNNTALPKTGAEDSLPIIISVVVFGVSAVYAYRKIQDYRDL